MAGESVISPPDRRQESRWPDLSDEALLRTLDDWLGPYLSDSTTLDRVTRLDLTSRCTRSSPGNSHANSNGGLPPI